MSDPIREHLDWFGHTLGDGEVHAALRAVLDIHRAVPHISITTGRGEGCSYGCGPWPCSPGLANRRVIAEALGVEL